MIEFRNVSCAYEKNMPVLQGLSFVIEEGQSVGLIGANGAGKSTVMKVLLGLLPYQGDVYVDGIRVEEKNFPQLRARMGFVLQNSDNQMFMPTVKEDMMFGPLNYGETRQKAEEKVDQVLRKLGVPELKDKYNHRLSGGEKRMAAIATILTMDPDILLMDEPTSALDPYNRRMIIRTINELPQTRIITSHDLDMIEDTCGRVILIDKGKLIADRPAQEILSDRRLLEKHRLELPLSRQVK